MRTAIGRGVTARVYHISRIGSVKSSRESGVYYSSYSTVTDRSHDRAGRYGADRFPPLRAIKEKRALVQTRLGITR